jgi:hypothetical protein
MSLPGARCTTSKEVGSESLIPSSIARIDFALNSTIQGCFRVGAIKR